MRKAILNPILVLLFLSCSGGNEDDDNNIDDSITTVTPPQAANLIFPENNTECNTGLIVNDNKSDVNFEWENAENTDLYEVTIRNLENNEITKSTVLTNSTVVRIDRGTLFEWEVKSMANKTEEIAVSEKWRFYNEGPGIINYSPFPAEAIYPKRGSTITYANEILLEWNANDLDNDLIRFEIFLGTAIDNIEFIGETDSLSFNITNLERNLSYYWQIKSIDLNNNNTLSEIFEFKTTN